MVLAEWRAVRMRRMEMKKEVGEMASAVGFLPFLSVKHNMTPGLCTEHGGWSVFDFLFLLVCLFNTLGASKRNAYAFGS